MLFRNHQDLVKKLADVKVVTILTHAHTHTHAHSMG